MQTVDPKPRHLPINIDAIKQNAVKKALERELQTQFYSISNTARDFNDPPLGRISEIRALLNEVEQLLAELEKQ